MLKKYFLPVGILLAVIWALTFPAAGLFCKKHITTPVMIITIFLVSGMQIKFSELKIDRKFILALITGALFSLCLLSFSGWLALHWIIRDGALLAGLLVMLAAPPTLSSGIVMTREAGGNMMLSIAITIIFNLAAIITLPTVLVFLLGKTDTGNVDAWKIFHQLLLTVLLPLLIGYGIKRTLMRSWYHTAIDYIPLTATVMLSLAFFAAAREQILSVRISTVLLVLVMSLIFHLFSMVVLGVAGKLLRMDIADCKAMIFCGASKSATMALALISIAGLGQSAAAVSCLIFYALQMFLDAFLAVRARNFSGIKPTASQDQPA